MPKLRKIPAKRVEKLTNHCLAIIKTSKSWGAFDKREAGQEYTSIFRPALTTGRQLNKQVDWVGGEVSYTLRRRHTRRPSGSGG